MLWRNDIEGVNVFIHACSELSAGEQYMLLLKLKSEIEKFRESGTVVMIDGVKYKNHHGL